MRKKFDTIYLDTLVPRHGTRDDLVAAVERLWDAGHVGPSKRPHRKSVRSALVEGNAVNPDTFDPIRDALVAACNADAGRLELKTRAYRTDTPHAKLADLLDRALISPGRRIEIVGPPGFHVEETFRKIFHGHRGRVARVELDCDRIGSGVKHEAFWRAALQHAAPTLAFESLPYEAAHKRLQDFIEDGGGDPDGRPMQLVLRKVDRYLARLLRDQKVEEPEKAAGGFLLDVVELAGSSFIFGSMTLKAYMRHLGAGSPTLLSTEAFPLCDNWEAWSRAQAEWAARDRAGLVGELEELSGRHPEAFARGLVHASPPNPDRDAMADAVRRVHRETAADLLELVAPDCRDVLTKSAWVDPRKCPKGTLDNLAVSGILRNKNAAAKCPEEGVYEPVIPAWMEFWSDAR